MISVGERQAFGLFLAPLSLDLSIGRESYGLAIALQNLLWGLLQPFAGMFTDRWGAGRVLAVGGGLYALGLLLMAVSNSTLMLYAGAGVLVGVGLAACSFGVAMGVVARAFPPERRSWALGVAGAGGSFGQFAMLPLGQALISAIGWRAALVPLALMALSIVALAVPLSGVPQRRESSDRAGLTPGLRAPLSEKRFWFLTVSFAVCGFQTVFMMIHLPAFALDRGLPVSVAVTALALVGLCNVIGSYGCGLLGTRFPKNRILAVIFAFRAIVIAGFMAFPVTPLSMYVLAIAVGVTWLGTVPLTNGLVADLYGLRHISTLFGVTFLGHQVGSFLGAWYGGYVFDTTGSYQWMWVLCVLSSVVAAALCWAMEYRPPAARQPAWRASA